MKANSLMFVLICCVFTVSDISAQGTKIRDLPALTSTPSADDMIPIATVSPATTRKIDLHTLAGYLITDPGLVPSTRAIACTPPLLCDGDSSTDLSADRTFSISAFYLPLTGASWTPSGSPYPFTFYSVGSVTNQSPTNQGLRTSTWSGFDTRASASDGVLMQLSCEQSSHSGTIVRTCMGIDSYTEPDNGGDTSGLLVRCVGGGPCITAYKASGLRRAGLTDQSLSPQPAIEVGTSDAGPAIIASAGVGVWGTSKTNEAIEQRLGSSTSIGNLVWPTNGTYDSRIAYAIGAPQSNAQPVNMTYKVLASGDEYHFTGNNTWQIVSSIMKLTNDTGDGSAQAITFRKSRLGLAVNTNEDLGDLNFNLVNSTPAEVQGSVIRSIVTDKTATSEDVDTVFYQVGAGTLAERFRIGSTGNVVATGTVAGSNLSGSLSGTSSGTNTGDQVVPTNTASTASQWFSAYNSATGVFTKTQPAMADLSDSTTWKGWTDGGTNISTTTSTDKVGVGTSTPTSLLTVSANSSVLPAPTFSGTVAHFSSADTSSTRLLIDTFGAATGAVDFRYATGTAASPANITTIGTNLGQITWFGRGSTTYAAGGRAAIKGLASEVWSDTVQGTEIGFFVTPSGGTSTAQMFTIKNSGHLETIGTAPTVSCTGTGTSPTAPSIDTGGTDAKFTITMNTGTGSPGSTGTCTVTFAAAYVTNKPVMVCALVDGAAVWGNEAVVRISTQSLTAPVLTWTNEVTGVLTGLTVSTNYKLSCLAMQ